MDNELTKDLKEVTKTGCKMELLPLGYHSENAAELAIKIFKAHIIANFAWPSTIFSPLSVVQAVTHRLQCTESTQKRCLNRHDAEEHDYNDRNVRRPRNVGQASGGWLVFENHSITLLRYENSQRNIARTKQTARGST